MRVLPALAKTAYLAVFLVLAAACFGGGHDFEPAPGASVDESDLESLIEAAVSDFGLQWRLAQPEPLPGDGDRPTCFEVESGPCMVPRGPSLTVALQGEDGVDVLVRVGLGVDSLEAGDRVDSAVTGGATRRRRPFA